MATSFLLRQEKRVQRTQWKSVTEHYSRWAAAIFFVCQWIGALYILKQTLSSSKTQPVLRCGDWTHIKVNSPSVSFVVLPVLVPPERGGRWRLTQVWSPWWTWTWVAPRHPAGRTTAARCRRTSVWLRLMNCLVEQNYIMLVFFKRVWQLLKYTGWCYNWNRDAARGNR